VYFLGVKAADA